ncbi:hypothetical protein BD779DRAFT_1802631 [Infundibulicybe gibba]|nr:hypothetical protein BD779DRAFT_1802631 [Infundibulicybe gibba]
MAVGNWCSLLPTYHYLQALLRTNIMPPAMTPPPSAPMASSGNRTLIICGVFALVAIGILALFALGVLARSICSRLVLEKEPDLECTLIDVESAQKMILAHNDLIRTPEPVFQHHRTEMYREIYRPGPPQKIVLDDIREPIYPKVFSAFPGTEVPVNVVSAPEVDQPESITEDNTTLGQETISAADTTSEIAISQARTLRPFLAIPKPKTFQIPLVQPSWGLWETANSNSGGIGGLLVVI